jgi:hypothetical protein
LNKSKAMSQDEQPFNDDDDDGGVVDDDDVVVVDLDGELLSNTTSTITTPSSRFFTKPNSTHEYHRNKRAGLGSEKLSSYTASDQKKQANEKMNSELRYNLLQKHNAKKRNKRKGLLIDYGESDEESNNNNDGDNNNKDGTNKRKKKSGKDSSSEDDSYSGGKSSRFSKKKSHSSTRKRIQNVQNILNQVFEQVVDKSDSKQTQNKKKRKTV